MNIYIPSVDAAASMIYSAYVNENFDRLREIQEYLESRDVARRIAGSASEFHNASVSLTRIGFFDYAFSLLEVAQERYPRDTDILADLLLYGMKCRNLSELREYQKKLENIDKPLWTWRAFHFQFDYLLEELRYAETDTAAKELAAKIEVLIKDYKENSEHFADLSDKEKAYMVEYEYYSFKRDKKKAIDALKAATIALPNKCAQCALKLADHYFEVGDNKNAIKYSELAVNIKEDQPSISLGYAYYILAMSREHDVRNIGGALAEAKVKPIFSAYAAAVEYMREESGREGLLKSVKNQVKTLEYDSGVPSKINFSNVGSGASDLRRLLESKLMQESE